MNRRIQTNKKVAWRDAMKAAKKLQSARNTEIVVVIVVATRAGVPSRDASACCACTAQSPRFRF